MSYLNELGWTKTKAKMSTKWNKNNDDVRVRNAVNDSNNDQTSGIQTKLSTNVSKIQK